MTDQLALIREKIEEAHYDLALMLKTQPTVVFDYGTQDTLRLAAMMARKSMKALDEILKLIDPDAEQPLRSIPNGVTAELFRLE